MRRWYIAITLVIILGISFAIIIPTLVNSSIQSTVIETLRRDFGLKQCAYVRVDPGILSPLYGSVDRVYIECPSGGLSSMRAKSLVITLRGIKFDLKKLIFERELTIREVDDATARLVVGDDDVNRYIADNYRDLRGWTVSFKRDTVVASADIEAIGRLDVLFRPRVKGDKLVLELIDAKFARIGHLGLREAQIWIRDIELDVPVSNLPFGMRVNRVLIQEGQLVVTARN